MQTLTVAVLALVATVYSMKDLGQPGWTCDVGVMKKSKTVPTSIHSLRPADIDVVGAIGDSLTAGNGAGAHPDDPVAVLIQYRGLTFAVGGDKTLDEHITVANVLKRFNADVFGYSTGSGSANNWELARLNVGIPGAHSGAMLEQAKDIVMRMREHPEIDFDNHWKAIFLFIGGNDMCSWCKSQDNVNNPEKSASEYRDNIKKAVQYLHDNSPRTIVVMTGMIDLALLRRVDPNQEFCQFLHTFECGCEMNKNVTDAVITAESKLFMKRQQELQDSGIFDDKDDFTLLTAPYFEAMTDVARNPDGSPQLEFFSPDCFHFSAYGHAVVGKYLWNNMMQPVGSQMVANLTAGPTTPLLCPDASCPFVRTTKNSKDCSKYMTPSE